DDIFVLGREMQETLAGRITGQPQRLVVGVVDQVPKTIVHKLLEPTLHGAESVRLTVREDALERLLADLSMHSVDLVISDAPIGSSARIKAFNHLLGETDVSIYGSPNLAATYKKRFPQSLDGAPMLMPTDDSQLSRTLMSWFDSNGIRPQVIAEIEDSALLKMFGQGGLGLFPAPTAVEEDVVKRYGVKPVGRIEAVRERFYAISVERKITHPIVREITSRAVAALGD
ncbi:MAG: LysR family transcriptional regulator, partial [Gemmatimonadetes bacterium]|nr:LysR family transcriptional regulator [Gemmatimonadota bacterium]